MTKLSLLTAVLFFSLPLSANSAPVTTTLFKGRFQASQACEAFESTTRRTNFDSKKTTPGIIYRVVAERKIADETYYLIILNAESSKRWVKKDCGELLEATTAESTTSGEREYDVENSVYEPKKTDLEQYEYELPTPQIETQQNTNEGAAVGENNTIQQDAQQSTQQQSQDYYLDYKYDGPHGSGGGVNDFSY